MDGDVDDRTRPDGMDSDEAWAQRALSDRNAYAELVRRYADRIFNLAYRMTGNRDEADDLAQETFIRAYRGLPGFRPDGQFGAWLYRIAVNVCLTHRRRSRDTAGESLDEMAAPVIDMSLSIEELAEQHEVQAAVHQAILSLPERYRAVVVLYHLEGRSYSEIAAILDLPVNTVRTHLHRGRVMLRDRLAANGQLPAGDGAQS
jgi:RNA polymerase sigma-70 factor, ECF subfamily